MRSKHALYNIIFSLILQIITIICSFIVPKLVIGKYGSNVNGLVSSITQFLAVISLIDAGFGPVIKSCLFKPISDKNEDEIKTILKSSERTFKRVSYIFIIYILVLCFVLPIFYKNDFNIVFSLSLIIIISISTFFEYYLGMTYKIFLQAKQKNYIVSIIQIITLIMNTIMVIILIHFKANIQFVKICSSLIFVLRPILHSIYVKSKYKIDLKNIDSNYKIEQKWEGLVQHIAHIIHTNTDTIIISLFCVISEVSVYSIYFLIINNVKNVICYSFISGVDSMFGDMIAKEEKLPKYFNIYEGVYFTISTILFICTFCLIIPFVKIYTSGITDANYIRPIFAYIMVISEFIYVIRQLYYSLVKVAGHFKQTKVGAIIEALTNISISLILVNKFGIIGVAIGTLVATIIRTIDIGNYTSKYILNRSIVYLVKRIILTILEFLIVLFIIKKLPVISIINYYTWIKYSIIVGLISLCVVSLINVIVNFKNIEKIKYLIRRKVK